MPTSRFPFDERGGQAPVVPEYPGWTPLEDAATVRSIHTTHLRRLLRNQGLKPEDKQGRDGYGRVVWRSYLRNSDLEQLDKDRKPGRPIDDEITVEEAAAILWPDEAKELRKLRASASKGAIEKLKQKHLSHVYHLVRQELLTVLDEAHKREAHFTSGDKSKRALRAAHRHQQPLPGNRRAPIR